MAVSIRKCSYTVSLILPNSVRTSGQVLTLLPTYDRVPLLNRLDFNFSMFNIISLTFISDMCA